MVIKYYPDGSIGNTVAIMAIPEGISEPKKFIRGSRVLVQHKECFKEFHTSMQRKLFRERLNNLASVKPAVFDFIYSKLGLDSSAATSPAVRECLRLIYNHINGV